MVSQTWTRSISAIIGHEACFRRSVFIVATQIYDDDDRTEMTQKSEWRTATNQAFVETLNRCRVASASHAGFPACSGHFELKTKWYYQFATPRINVNSSAHIKIACCDFALTLTLHYILENPVGSFKLGTPCRIWSQLFCWHDPRNTESWNLAHLTTE